MFNKQDPVGRTTEMTAKLFAVMADEIIRDCGEVRGSALVQRAVRRYAMLRAETVKAHILADGKEVTFETVEEYSDYPANCAWDCDTQIEGDTLREVTRSCPFSTAFRELGLEQAGRLYCDTIDLALNEAFFGEIEFERPRIFAEGTDAPCEMIVRLKNKGERRDG